MVDELIPLRTTVLFAHAIVQVIGEEVGVDLLHIKGPAVESAALGMAGSNAELRRVSVDADILVRPNHVHPLLEALCRHGWSVLYDFRGGSPFEHAATLGREDVANVDIHRYFPGIELDAEQAFDTLWSERRTIQLAGYPVHVPSLTAQRLILILHAARNAGGMDDLDIDRAWTGTSPASRSDVSSLAAKLQARVALAAGSGTLDSVRGERSHDLWAALSAGERSQVRLWRARVRAAPTRRAAVRIGVRLLLPNLNRLTADMGRSLSLSEKVAAYRVQARRGFRALGGWTRPGEKPSQGGGKN